MNLMNLIPKGLSRTAGKLWLKVQKGSPELFIAGGIVCGAGALVLVGVKTWKNKDILAEDAKRIKEAKKAAVVTEQIPAKDKNGNVVEGEFVSVTTKRKMTEEESKALWAGRLDMGKDILKTYWAPALLATAGGAMIVVGKKKYGQMLSLAAAAIAARDERLAEYRKLVAGEIGKDKEEQLAYGYRYEEHVDSETGKTDKIPITTDKEMLNPYCFWFDEGVDDVNSLGMLWRNMEHDRDKLVNRMTVRRIEEETYRKRITIGYAWLEDVAIKFGIDPEEAKKFHGIGWLYDPNGDNRVSFGVLEGDDQLEVNKGFTDDTCSQNKCLICPNVTGYIGFVRDNYEQYDMRYGFGRKREKKNMAQESEKVIRRYNREKMERRIFTSMSDEGKMNLLRRATVSLDD